MEKQKRNPTFATRYFPSLFTLSLTLTLMTLSVFDVFHINDENVRASLYVASTKSTSVSFPDSMANLSSQSVNTTPTTSCETTETETTKLLETAILETRPTPEPTPTPKKDLTPQERYEQALADGTVKPAQNKHLTRTRGVFKGPSGRETYYNLKMNEVVATMRRKGYSKSKYPYWVRDDGVKMLGNYVIVAANLKIRPKGTILESSLGTAIVCDTGGFVKHYPKGLDIAVNW